MVTVSLWSIYCNVNIKVNVPFQSSSSILICMSSGDSPTLAPYPTFIGGDGDTDKILCILKLAGSPLNQSGLSTLITVVGKHSTPNNSCKLFWNIDERNGIIGAAFTITLTLISSSPFAVVVSVSINAFIFILISGIAPENPGIVVVNVSLFWIYYSLDN